MTRAQKQLKKKLIAAIHMAPRYRNLYREETDLYRELLRQHFGVESSTQMSIDQLLILLEYLKMRTELPEDATDPITSAQATLLRRLWAGYARDTSERALLHFVARYHERGLPIRLELLSKTAAQKAIIALKRSSKGAAQ